MGVSYGKLWLRLEKPTAEAKHRQRDDPHRVIVVGMEGAGKSTMMHQLRLGEVQSVVPTLGVHLEKIEHTDVSIVSWDLVPLDGVRRMHREACVGRCSEAGGPQDGFSTLLLFSLPAQPVTPFTSSSPRRAAPQHIPQTVYTHLDLP